MAVVAIIILMYLVEGLTDYFIIKNQKDDGADSRKWHLYNSAFHVLIMFLIIVLLSMFSDLSHLQKLAYVMLIPTTRWVFFNSMLNYLRGKKYYYRGKNEEALLVKYPIFFWWFGLIIYGINVALVV